MRILLLTDNYPPESNAPAIRSSTHAQRWVAEGHDVTVVTCFPNFPEGKVFGGYRQTVYKREVLDTVDVVRVPTLIYPNRGTVLRILDFLSFMVTGTIAALCVRRPDVVVATSPQFFTAVAGWLVSALRRRPFVFEVRDLWPDSVVAVGAMKDGVVIKAIRRLEQFLYRRADLIVAVTHAFRDALVARGINGDKIVVVSNGIDARRFTPGPPPAELVQKLGLAGKIVVSYIGTAGMAHGLSLVLDAAQACRTRLPEVQFLIVGAGAELDRLKTEAAERGLANVTFVGRVPHAETIHYWRLSAMTLVLLKDVPLFRKVIPSKIFEAMATGTPIITNVRGEVWNVLESVGAAELVAPDSADALAAAIEALARDPARRRALSVAGAEAAKRFDRAVLARQMLEALQRLVAGGPATPRPAARDPAASAP